MVKTWRMEKSLRMLRREEVVDGLKKFLETRRQIVSIDIQKLSSAEAKQASVCQEGFSHRLWLEGLQAWSKQAGRASMGLGWRKEVNHTTDSWQNWTTQMHTTHSPRVGQMFASSCSIKKHGLQRKHFPRRG